MIDLDDVKAWLQTYKFGVFSALVSGHRNFRRTNIDTDFGVNLKSAQRVSPPIIDVVPKTGTRVAVICKDALPEHPVVIGEIFDDKTDDKTVWIRADLETLPGHVQIGATESVNIRIGSNPGLDGHAGVGSGKIRIGSDAVDLVAQLETALDLVKQLAAALQLSQTATALGNQPLINAASFAAIEVSATAEKAKVTGVKS